MNIHNLICTGYRQQHSTVPYIYIHTILSVLPAGNNTVVVHIYVYIHSI